MRGAFLACANAKEKSGLNSSSKAFFIMDNVQLIIKHMVCDRCVQAVREELEKVSIQVVEIELGKATVRSEQGGFDLAVLKRVLENRGFELIRDKREEMVERVKLAIIQLIHYNTPPSLGLNYSEFLAQRTERDYKYLSHLFSALENTTIERYIILQKIERAKELITYDELSIGQIARQLHYSSLAHFSNQFKMVTQQTPSQYKKTQKPLRKSLDKLS
jgi:AraC family transcriptional regulator